MEYSIIKANGINNGYYIVNKKTGHIVILDNGQSLLRLKG